MNTKKRRNNKVHSENNVPVLKICEDALMSIVETIGGRNAESGGVIGGNREVGLITHFHFEESSQNSSASYSPDYKFLNHLLSNEWNPNNIRLHGFVHSHPGGSRPLFGDETYAEEILKVNPDIQCLWLPIVSTLQDTGIFKIVPWAVFPLEVGVEVVQGKIMAVDINIKKNSKLAELHIPSNELLDELTISQDILNSIPQRELVSEEAVSYPTSHDVYKAENPNKRRSSVEVDLNNAFDRVKDVYDLELMKTSRIIVVGAGGASSWIEETVRAGIGQIITGC